MTVAFTIRLDRETVERIDALAAREERSRNQIVQRVIRAAMAGGTVAQSPAPLAAEARPHADAYLASLAGLLDEWSSPEDAKAFDGL